MIREEGRHLLLALEILLLGVAESVRAVDVLVGSQADKPVVRRSVLLVHEMHVIGGDNLDPVLFGQVEDDLVVLLLLFIDLQRLTRNLGLVEHYLEVVVILEHPLVPLYGLVRPFHVACENHSRNLSRHAGGGADEILVILFNDFVRDPRSVVHSLDMRSGYNLHQILVSVIVLGEENEVIISSVSLVLELVVELGNIYLTADYGLYGRMLPGELEELLYAVHVAVVGDRQCRHPQRLGFLEQFVNGRETVQNRVLGMYVKMYERHCISSRLWCVLLCRQSGCRFK